MLILPVFAQENTGSLEIFIKNESGDRVIPDGLEIKIFKDLEVVPIQKILLVENNPITISTLPQNHRYKVEVYMNGMYADVGFVDLKENHQRVEITIKNTGGMRLNIFYADGETPLSNAQVWIRSHDGKVQSYSETDQNGQTMRAWLYPSIKEGNYYYAEILLGPNIKYVYSPIKLQPNIAQEFKIITKWPVIVDKLFTVEVYNTTKNKITRQDGIFVAELYDIKKNKIAESPVSDKGLAHFSKLKVNNYALHIKTKDDTGQLKTIATKKVTLTDTTNTIKIYLNNPELNSDHLNCNCVAFRLDDIQDFYLAPAQIAIISTFEERNVPLTLGVIGGAIGTDQKLVSTIKNGLDDNLLELANHSWRHGIYTKMKKADQEVDLIRTNQKISEVFGVLPITFIPPENSFNNDTISVLQANNFTHISYGELGPLEEPPKFLKSSFYHFPMFAYTAKLDREKGLWQQISAEQTLDQIDSSLFNYGYAVVMMHPSEFSAYENGGYVNKVNATKLQELNSIIDKLQANDIKILRISSIQDFDKPTPIKTTVQESVMPNCNCVAFRLDNVQDFWLNDVQNTVIDTFVQNKIPLTLTVIGKFIGDDPKTINFIKEKLENKLQIKIASRGWEYVDHTLYDKEKQKASIKQTGDKIKKIFNKDVVLFSPPYNAFNNDTVDAAKEAGILYFSSRIKDSQLFPQDSIKNIPDTITFANLVDDDPFFYGRITQKAIAKIQSSIKQHGYAVISLQPSDLAIKTDTFKNEINSERLALLKDILSEIKSNQFRIIGMEFIPDELSNNSIVIPDWIKNNAKWWSEDKIDDSTFIKGIEYLINNDIIMMPSSANSESTLPESKEIPTWIKTNAKWWYEGKIQNSDFVKGIQYMINKGVIRLALSTNSSQS